MNRNDEFDKLMEELNGAPPELEDTVRRAQARAKNRRTLNWIVRPLGSLAAVFALFVLLVNASVTFAHAVVDIPVLGDLAAAVCWSGSLRRAVENDYMQAVGQTKAGDGFTVTVEYVIVDQQQVNIFYSIRSVDPKKAYQLGTFELGPDAPPCGIVSLSPGEAGGLWQLTVDFAGATVPDSLTLTMYIIPASPGSSSAHVTEPPSAVQMPSETHRPDDPLADAQAVTFELTFDPTYTASGETYAIGQWVELDGQRIYVDRLEVYPTHARLKLANGPENELVLKGLYFYLEDERGNRYEREGGITALGDPETGFYFDGRVSSPYFTDPKHLTLHITGAEWLDESKSAVTVDIANGTAAGMPEGAIYQGIVDYPDCLALSFRVPRLPNGGAYGSFFKMKYTDPTGETHEVTRGGSSTDDDPDTFEAMFLLPTDYEYDTVTLDLTITQWGSFAEPVTVEIK